MVRSVSVRAFNIAEARKKVKKHYPSYTVVRMRVGLKEYDVLLKKKKK